MKSLVFGVIALFLVSACVKDKPQPLVTEAVTIQAQDRVWITCEGNFGSGNSSLSLYDKTSKTVVKDAYQDKNKTSCGDVLQSMFKWRNAFYLVVNNSSKIIVCDAEMQKTGEIKGLSSPRYFLPVTNNKAYVSDLKANAIHVIDLNTNAITGSIVCSGWTERMQMIYNRVFVTNVSSKYVYVINTATDKIEDSVQVGYGATSLALDKNDKLWVLSPGKLNSNESVVLSQIDPVSLNISSKLTLQTGSAFGLCSNASGDRLYFLQDGLKVLNIDNQIISTVIDGTSANFYGVDLDPKTGSIYLSDAMDYTQASTIYIYDAQGRPVSNFKAGVNANGFYFE